MSERVVCLTWRKLRRMRLSRLAAWAWFGWGYWKWGIVVGEALERISCAGLVHPNGF